jgi:valyl-tRNA synthetase
MTTTPAQLASRYVPADVEPHIAARWNAAAAFHVEPPPEVPPASAHGQETGTPYCIVIPPPNVTAALHLGHALNNTLQDILIRQHRMRGFNTLWMPGTDHAGIATQTVVEKRVLAEEGKRRTDFAREDFVAKIQAWKDEYEQRITDQLKAMGCSCDWDRQRFTMDPICAKAVREAFFRLFQDGLIYRGKRLVNWDPATQTALADDEVEMEEIDGHFYYLKYPVCNAQGLPASAGMTHITVATTRPETMLGDTAVAVNPRDPRAAALKGKFVKLPIVNRVIPIIEDDYVVLPNPDSDDAKAKFATGFLKVTPAHDPNDYDIGQRHRLPIINVFSPTASISKDHGWPPEEWSAPRAPSEPSEPARVGPVPCVDAFAHDLLGQDRYDARKQIVKWFTAHDLFVEQRPYRHSVGHSYRSHVAIEPYLSDQWYVKVTDDRLSGAALRALADGGSSEPARVGPVPDRADTARLASEKSLRFTPSRYANTFRAWHENIRDWCISRQLWWGHRIPVWSKDGCLAAELAPRLPSDITAVQEINDQTFVCLREDDHQSIALIEGQGFTRDPDVLDTWFSSGLWPISTLGWPDDTPELQTWNPGNVLCTAREIITLWVSRMVMFNLYFRGTLPFTDVFIHAMIQDGEGRKMSKSLGNGVDPLDIIHSHGSDAMRFTLAAMTTNTQDVRLPVERDPASGRNTSPKFDQGRNFANKLWNAVRFALTKLSSGTGGAPVSLQLSIADRWILSRLTATIRAIDESLSNYEFSVYASALYDFIWRDFCDWYIEAVKPTVESNPTQQRVLAACLDAILRLLHPVMPFVSEKLWEHLNAITPASREIEGLALPPGELLVKAAWPVCTRAVDEEAERELGLVQRVVSALREMRTTYKVPPRQTIDVSAKAPPAIAQRMLAQRELIEILANVSGREIGPHVARPADAAVSIDGEIEHYAHGLIDADAEKTRLSKRRDELNKTIATLEGRLNNPSYADKAPAHLVQQTRDQLTLARKERDGVSEQLAAL